MKIWLYLEWKPVSCVRGGERRLWRMWPTWISTVEWSVVMVIMVIFLVFFPWTWGASKRKMLQKGKVTHFWYFSLEQKEMSSSCWGQRSDQKALRAACCYIKQKELRRAASKSAHIVWVKLAPKALRVAHNTFPVLFPSLKSQDDTFLVFSPNQKAEVRVVNVFWEGSRENLGCLQG